MTVPAWAVPPAMGDLGWVAEKHREVFGWSKYLVWGQAQASWWPCCCLRGAATPPRFCSAAVKFLGCSGVPILSWAERRVHGPPCAEFWEAVPALLFLILPEPALLLCVLGSLHTTLLAFFSNGTHLSDGELCKWRCKLDSAPGCLASLPAVLSVLENCAPLLLQGKLSSASFLFFFPL